MKKSEPITLKRQMERFIEQREPELARIIERATDRMGNSISYEDIRNALLSGEISEEWLEKWRVLYSEFIIRTMVPIWRESMAAGVARLQARYPKFLFDPTTQGIQDWATVRAGSLVTSVVEQQRAAIRAIVSRAVQIDGWSVDELAKVIRPVVGLYPAQAAANFKYYNFVKDTLMAKHPRTNPAKIMERAQRSALRYASVQHRARAMTIARTELAAAYGAGAHYGVLQAQEQNYMGEVEKYVLDAGDERVCAFCKEVCGKRFKMNDPIPLPRGVKSYNGEVTVPLHPRCRCVMIYEEVSPPIPFMGNS